MTVPKRIEYSVRALVALAAAEPATVNARILADTQDIPPGYLYDVLADLRRVELVSVLRGSHGGYALSRPAAEITLGSVVRLLDGTSVSDPVDDPRSARLRDPRSAKLRDPRSAKLRDPRSAMLRDLWEAATRAGHSLLDSVTIADIARL